MKGWHWIAISIDRNDRFELVKKYIRAYLASFSISIGSRYDVALRQETEALSVYVQDTDRKIRRMDGVSMEAVFSDRLTQLSVWGA